MSRIILTPDGKRLPQPTGPDRTPSSAKRTPTGKRLRLARLAELQALQRQPEAPPDATP